MPEESTVGVGRVYFTYTGESVYHYDPECATKNDGWRQEQPERLALSAEYEPCGTCVGRERDVLVSCMSCGETSVGNDRNPKRFADSHTGADCPANEPVIVWEVTDAE